MRLNAVGAVFGAALLLAIATAAEAAQKVTDFRLANGMEVVVIEDHRAPVVTHMVWYRVGAADDPYGHSGIAHFFEHLMFKATEHLADGEFSKIVAANGGRDNAFTSYDFTAYFQVIAADRLDLVMGMEAERMRGLLLTDEVVSTERDVILEERSTRTDNNPSALFGEQMDAALYMNHHYGIPVIGWRHEIASLDAADAQAFYRRYYAPDNAILVIAGDVTPEQVRTLAEARYGPLEPSGHPPDPRPQEPPQLAPRRIEMHDDRVRQPYVMRSYLVPTYDAANPRQAAALALLSDILGDGIASRLSQSLELRQKIATGSGAWYSADRRDATEFGLYGVPAEGVGLAEVEEALDAVLAEIVAEGPTEDELARVKRLARAAHVFAEDDVSSLARRYGTALAAGQTVADVQGWPEAVAAVTAEDVRAAAALLKLDSSVTGWLMGVKEQG